MQRNAFAARVLLGTTLDDKLARPGRLRDDAPGAAWTSAPTFPGRPAALEPGARPPAPFPRDTDLDRPDARGAALHAFANHELLAIEVMALTLLRFPDAPEAFRADVMRTLVEEQRHLRQYIARMAEVGVSFGDHAVNDWFWRCASDLRQPVDHVVRMSMTFEQANLDFATHYRDAFSNAGDAETAAVLDGVLRDEIRHVAMGLQWFDVWRDPSVRRFEAWRRALPDGLSPTRAKGVPFRAEARVAAGMSDDEIDELKRFTWRQTQGATLWLANLDADKPVDGTLPRAARELAMDLDASVGFLAQPGDVVRVAREPSRLWQRQWYELGVHLPHFITAEASAPVPVARARAWAPSPAWHHDHRHLPRPAAHDPQALSKAITGELLGVAYEAVADASTWFGPLRPPTVCHNDEHVHLAVRALRAQGAWIKPLIGSSGRGHVQVAAEACADGKVPARSLTAARHAGVSVEPWFDRLLDLSALQADAHDAIHLSRPLVGGRGQYRGHVIGSPWRGVDDALRRALLAPRGGVHLHDVLKRAATAVFHHVRERYGVAGPLGIDMFAYRDGGEVFIRPVVELNARCTMGHVALALGRHVHPSSHARWLHLTVNRARDADLQANARLHPRSGRIEACTMPTADPAAAVRAEPWLFVAQDAQRLSALLEPLGAAYS